MGRLSERLREHSLVGLDTSIFIYHFESHPRYIPLTTELLAGVEAGERRAVTSVVTLMELTVRPWQVNAATVAREYEILLVHFPNLTVLDVTRTIARHAARLRALYRIRPADAIQAATAIVNGATTFVTNDQQLRRLATELDIVVLDDLI